jgi:hypothetical protein
MAPVQSRRSENIAEFRWADHISKVLTTIRPSNTLAPKGGDDMKIVIGVDAGSAPGAVPPVRRSDSWTAGGSTLLSTNRPN